MTGAGTKGTWLSTRRDFPPRSTARLQGPITLKKHLSESRKQDTNAFIKQAKLELALQQPSFKTLKKTWQVNKILKVPQGIVFQQSESAASSACEKTYYWRTSQQTACDGASAGYTGTVCIQGRWQSEHEVLLLPLYHTAFICRKSSQLLLGTISHLESQFKHFCRTRGSPSRFLESWAYSSSEVH